MRTIIKIAIWIAAISNTVIGLVALIGNSVIFRWGNGAAMETIGLIFGIVFGVFFLVLGIPLIYFAIKNFQLPAPKKKEK